MFGSRDAYLLVLAGKRRQGAENDPLVLMSATTGVTDGALTFALVLSSDRRDWRVAPSTLSVPYEQGPSGIVRAASGLIIKWTRFAVGFIGRHALKLHDSLFTNEHYAVTGDAYSFESALYPAGLAR